MTRFAVGEQVVIRYGRQQGHKAIILPSRWPDAYKVRVEDGSIRFYSGKGLQQEPERIHQVVS
jgi:hypothetical protein